MGDAHGTQTAGEFCDRVEGNQLAAGRTDVEERQRGRVQLVLRFHFHDHPVLIHVGVNRRDLALAISVVKRVLNLVRRHAQRVGLVAVDFHRHLRVGDEQIAGHILKPTQLRHFVHQNRRPMIKLLGVGALQRVLIKRFGERAADANQGRVLQKSLDTRHPRQFQAELLDDLVGVQTAFGPRLEANENAPAVRADRGASHADRRGEIGDIRVRAHNPGHGKLVFAQGVKRNPLRGLGDAENLPGVFTREKALRNHDEQPGRRDKHGYRENQRHPAMPHHRLQSPVIHPVHTLKEPFRGRVEPAALPPVRRANKSAAHHGGEGQRYKPGNQHGHRDGDGEFMQQPPEDAAHEQHRNEHGSQRERHGNDRETDFSGPLQRCLHRGFALLHVTHDVFQHHNGVVHDEPHADRDRHQRQVIQAVAQQLHNGKRPDDGHRHGQARNDRGGKIAQEEKNDHYHQANRQDQSELDVRDGFTDRLRAVIEDFDVHRGRKLGAELRQQLANPVHHFNGVLARLALDRKNDGACVIEPARHLVVLHAVEHAAQLLQTHWPAVTIRHNERAIIRRLGELAGRLNGVRLMFSVKRAGRKVHVPRSNGRPDFINPDPARGEFVRVQLHANRILLRTEHGHLCDTVHHRDTLRHQSLTVIVHR